MHELNTIIKRNEEAAKKELAERKEEAKVVMPAKITDPTIIAGFCYTGIVGVVCDGRNLEQCKYCRARKEG